MGILAFTSWLELDKHMKAGIVVLCEAGCHWLKDDAVRLMPSDAEEWLRIDDVLRQLLKGCNIEHSIIPEDMADIKERVKFAEKLIRAS